MSRYAWPPLPVLDPVEASRRLGEALQAAWQELEDERLAVLANPALGRKAFVDAWIKEFQAQIIAAQAEVDRNVRIFIQGHLEPRYQSGVLEAQVDKTALSWTAGHQLAMTSLSTDTYADFLARSNAAGAVSDDFVAALRAAAAETIPRTATGATTARQAASKFATVLRDKYQIDVVVYANGALVPVGFYAEMAALTKSAVAYNAGALNQGIESGVKFVEVFDGGDCGWTSHNDIDKANGSVRSISEAQLYAISHPRCTRSFGMRPEVVNPSQAKKAEPSTTAEQRADSLIQERIRAAKAAEPVPQPARPAVRSRDMVAERRASRTS